MDLDHRMHGIRQLRIARTPLHARSENKRRDASYGPVGLDKAVPVGGSIDHKVGPIGNTGVAVEKAEEDEASEIVWADLTDKEQTSFRYSL
jgi:hypothetical protein